MDFLGFNISRASKVVEATENTEQNTVKEDKGNSISGTEEKNMSMVSGLKNIYDTWKAPKRYSKNTASTKNIDWVYAVTTLIGNYVAETDLNLYVSTGSGQSSVKNYKTSKLSNCRKKALNYTGEEEIEQIYGHPSQLLLETVNNYTDGFALIGNTQVSIDITGDSYWYIVKQDGVPIELHQLNPIFMEILVNEAQTDIIGYKYQTSEGAITFTKDEIVKFSNNTYDSRFYGVSPIMRIAGYAEMLELTKDFEYSLLKNGGVPPAVLKIKDKIDPAKMRTLENQWRKNTLGTSRNSVKILSGDIEIEKIGLSMEDLMLKDSKVWNLKALCAAYQVPLPLLDAEAQKGGINSNDDVYVRMLAQQCIKPRLKKIEEVLNQQYLPMFDDSGRLFFKFENPVPVDEKQQAEITKIYVDAGVKTIDEARAELGLPSLNQDEQDNQDEQV